jgi:hypothetical protein
MEVARRYQIDAVTLVNRGERMTILNCNRQPLEQTLGVDLIYYNHRFDSFVLVQYKRMTKQSHGVVAYRPNSDQNHGTELKRMLGTERALRAIAKSKTSTYDGFRLSKRPFFLKLCESKAKVTLDTAMVSGMYIPLGLWLRLLRSPSSEGGRGGILIGWDNCPRRLNNGEFTNLLRNGWIGSAAGQSQYLSKIIEEVLGTGRMLIVAATSAAPRAGDFRRDEVGRFAADDDPFGTR